MLLISLRLLAGASYLDLHWPYGLSVSTVYRVFEQTLSALNKVLPPIQFPNTAAACKRSAERFQRMRKTPFDGVIAALDGLAVKIRQPCLTDGPDSMDTIIEKGFSRSLYRPPLKETVNSPSLLLFTPVERMIQLLFRLQSSFCCLNVTSCLTRQPFLPTTPIQMTDG